MSNEFRTFALFFFLCIIQLSCDKKKECPELVKFEELSKINFPEPSEIIECGGLHENAKIVHLVFQDDKIKELLELNKKKFFPYSTEIVDTELSFSEDDFYIKTLQNYFKSFKMNKEQAFLYKGIANGKSFVLLLDLSSKNLFGLIQY